MVRKFRIKEKRRAGSAVKSDSCSPAAFLRHFSVHIQIPQKSANTPLAKLKLHVYLDPTQLQRAIWKKKKKNHECFLIRVGMNKNVLFESENDSLRSVCFLSTLYMQLSSFSPWNPRTLLTVARPYPPLFVLILQSLKSRTLKSQHQTDYKKQLLINSLQLLLTQINQHKKVQYNQ